MAKVKTSKKSSPKGKGKSGTPAESVYSLTPARRSALEREVTALGDRVIAFPGRLKERIRWAQRIAAAASRDTADLVQTPFADEPRLTAAEIASQRDRVELLRIAESEYQGARAGQAAASKEFAKLADAATTDRELLLRAFDIRFRNDPRGQKRISAIRAGTGDADLVQDISDVLSIAEKEGEFLAACPRGEAGAVERLKRSSPELSRLLGAKTITEEARNARKLRDGAYTLVAASERRIRAAAEYWYGSTDKMKEYAAFPTSSAPGPQDESPGGEPGSAPGQGSVSAPTP